MGGLNQEEFQKAVREFTQKAEELERKVNEVAEEIQLAEKAAFERGLAVGMAAQGIETEGKTFVIKVPFDDLEALSSRMMSLQRTLKCKFILCDEHIDIKDLHELDLRALGLKKLE